MQFLRFVTSNDYNNNKKALHPKNKSQLFKSQISNLYL